jgi:hypothetical protein
MKPEKRQLIHDLLDAQSDARRVATFEAGGRVLRQRRRRRQWRQGMFALAVLLLLSAGARSLWLGTLSQPLTARNSFGSSVEKVAAAGLEEPAGLQSLTDAELLALFPDTPVALVTLHNGRQRLIFPRPEDQQRIIIGPEEMAKTSGAMPDEGELGL